MRWFTARHMAVLALLAGLGFAGNYFSIPFFFGIHWLFGSIATMIVIQLFGTGWGVLSALVISSYTHLLWGHPVGLVTFVLEALVVGLLANRFKETSLLILDGLFWLFVAPPLTWLAYTTLLDVDAAGTILIFLKQSVNGLFNALVAVLAVAHLPLHRWLLGEERRRRIPVSEALFHLLVAFLMLPALVSILLVSRHEVNVIYQQIEATLSNQSARAIDDIKEARDQCWRAVASLARATSREESNPTEELHEHLAMLLGSTPNLLRLSVLSPGGIVMATDSQGGAESPVPPPVREPLPHADIRAAMLPPDTPVITVSEPIVRNGQWVGTAQGMLDPLQARRVLQNSSEPFPLHLTLLDQSGRVLATSRSDLSALQQYDRAAGGTVTWVNERRYARSPGVHIAAINRWRQSQEVLETPLPGEGNWRMVAEVSMAPYRARLYQVYNKNLLIVFVLTFGTLIVSAMLSRWVARPLLQLTAITRYLPQRLKGGEEIAWPSSPVLEIDLLADDIRCMATALRAQFDEIEQEARQQRALLSAAMEATDLPVLITDEQERIVYVNPPFLQAYGYTQDEVLGRRPAFLRSPTSDKRAAARIGEAVRKGMRITLDVVNRHKNGTLVDTEMVLLPLRAPDGPVTHFVSIYRDISARKVVERMKSQFVLSLSQEMHRPLAAIRESLGLLITRAAQNSDPRNTMEVAVSHTDRLVSLLTAILEYEGIEAGRVDMHPESLPADHLVEQAVEQMRPGFESQGVALMVEVPALPVVADPARVTQALTHLLRHALASSKSGGQVRLSALPAADEVVFAIEDHGPGIPPSEIGQIFQAYDQGRLCTPALGLALARAVVRRLDGRMWVESEVGRGSTFFFSLPGGSTPAVCTGGTLLIYAEPQVAAPVRDALGPAGFSFTVVQNSAAAWDALSTRGCDTLLLDPRTPGAVDFLHELRQSLRFADLPVVIMGRLDVATDQALLQADPRDAERFKDVVRTARSRMA